MKKKNKGFTLIELLAVIVILGLLMAIAIPSVTKYITESRKKTVVSTIGNYITAMVNEVNDLTYTFTEANTIYAVPIECIALERGGTNPFGAWHQANDAYWAYVLVQYDDETSSYRYGYTFKDSAGYGLYPTSQSKLNEQGKQIQTGLDLIRPMSGKITTITNVSNWNGFDVSSTTNLIVLIAEKEGSIGDGKRTCTLQQKGNNYEDVVVENIEVLETNVLMKTNKVTNADAPLFGSEYKRSEVEAVYTQSNLDIPENAIYSWDVSATKNGAVVAWLLDADSDNLYELYLGATGKIIANSDSSYLFTYFSNVKTIDLSNFDTSKVLNMYGMFANCNSLTNLNISNFNTSKVKNMSFMFSRCSSLIELDLSHFNTKNVTNMRTMFQHCDKLTRLNVSSFDTSNVTDMAYMFAWCSSLINLDVRNFDTSNVTNMYGLFSYCSLLTSLDLSNFDTSNVIDMTGLFSHCSSLTSLDLKNFDTSKVINMKAMFQYCGALTSLDINNFDTSSVTDMSYMFGHSNNLAYIDIRSFDFSKVTTYEYMLNKVPVTSKIIVKDDNSRNWIKTNISSNYTNIVTVDEL